jgi:hypothetical protein
MSKERKIGFVIIISALVFLVIMLTSNIDKKKPTKTEGGLQNIVKNQITKNNAAAPQVSLDTPDFVIANKVMADFFAYINKKDYDKAYSMFDEAYKKDFELTNDLFRVKYEFEEEKIFTIKKLYKTNEDRIVADVVIESSNKDQGKGATEKSYTIYKKGDGKYTLADLPIIEEYKHDLTKDIKPNISAILTKTYKTTSGTVAIVKINNNTGNDLNIRHAEWGFCAQQVGIDYTHRLLNHMVDNYIVVGGTNKTYYLEFLQTDLPQTISIYETGDNPPETEGDGNKILLFELR